MIERYLGAALIAILIFFSINFAKTSPVYGNDLPDPTPQPDNLQPIITQSRFTTKLETQTQTIPRQTVYKDDPDLEAGSEQTQTEGADGTLTKVLKITFFEGTEYDREVVSTETTPAEDKIVLRGTKIVWRNLDSSNGQLSYWKKLRVWATQYDSHCPGCNDWTATGMRQGKGVIAVDPKVIPLGTKLYIPGYGMAVAGDTGGAIKGDIIDVGFPDAHTSGWQSHFVDIYFL